MRFEAGSIRGRVRVIGAKLDPKTQLIDVSVSLPASADFPLASFVEAKFVTASQTGLVVPRGALLPKGTRQKLFTVANGKAEEHIVDTGIETPDEIQIKGKGLRAGQPVVTKGNYELSSGMAVSSQSAK